MTDPHRTSAGFAQVDLMDAALANDIAAFLRCRLGRHATKVEINASVPIPLRRWTSTTSTHDPAGDTVMRDTLVIGSWASLHEGCEITADVGSSNAAALTVRGSGQPFELHVQAEPLRQLVEAASQALAEMDTLAIQEGAEQAAGRSA